MREARRQKALDQIDKLEKALRNIGFLGAEIEIEGTNIITNEFLHALYHAIKRSDGLKECDMCNKRVSSSVVHNGVRVCKDCVRTRRMWLMIPNEKLREAGWIE